MSKIRITKNQLRKLIKEILVCEDHSWAAGPIGGVDQVDMKIGVERPGIVQTRTPQPDCWTCDDADDSSADEDLLTEPDADEEESKKKTKDPNSGVDERELKAGQHKWQVGPGTSYPYKPPTADKLRKQYDL